MRPAEKAAMAKRQQPPPTPAVAGGGGTPARRWFRIGPGLLLAVAASVWVWQQSPRPPGGGRPPRIERTRVDNNAVPSAAPLLLSAPDPDWLLARRNTLNLTEKQTARLRALHARWQRDTRALRAALARAIAQFEQETAARSGVTIGALQERARPVSELSRQLADARRAWWDEAAAVFTPSQRQKAEQAWAQRFARPAGAPRQYNSDIAAHP